MKHKFEISIRKIAAYICYSIATVFVLVSFGKMADYNKSNSIGILGYRPVIVITGSMVPSIEVNSISILKYCTIDDINIGDVVMYKLDNGMLITHRVIGQKFNNNTKTLVTKGDANQFQDSIDIIPNMVEGKIVKTYNWVAPVLSTIMVEPGVINTFALIRSVILTIVIIYLIFVVATKLLDIIKAVYWSFNHGDKYIAKLDEYKELIDNHTKIYEQLVEFDKTLPEDTTLKQRIEYGLAKSKIIRELGYFKDEHTDILKAKKSYDKLTININVLKVMHKYSRYYNKDK